ncbi:MAG TPA: hypothetical protein VJ768_04505, partial [Anaerolineales bacterium]|nr:hypothetical protein [Anaerolineales bacterium]
MDNQSLDFEFILHQLPADDPRLREGLVKTWYTFVRGIAWSLIDDPDHADYAVFETFKEAWLKIDQFRTGSDFTVWLGEIAVKTASRYQQAATARAAVADPARDLRAGVKSLPSRLRLPTILYLLHDLSVLQIGEILGRRQKTAFGQLETGLQMLLLDGAQKYETSSGGNHDTTRRALLY